jgi:hypothetical protein
MALGFSFFKTPKHRVFNYQPLYYDERKEAMKERLERLQVEEMAKEGKYIPGKHIRHSMRKNFYHGKSKGNSLFITRLIIFVSLAGLMIMFYYFARYFSFLFNG